MLCYALWIFLVVRDVVRAREDLGQSVGAGWIAVALFVPFGVMAWAVYRNRLYDRDRPFTP